MANRRHGISRRVQYAIPDRLNTSISGEHPCSIEDAPGRREPRTGAVNRVFRGPLTPCMWGIKDFDVYFFVVRWALLKQFSGESVCNGFV